MPPGDQAQISADVPGPADARRIVDCGDKGEGGQLPYAGIVISRRQAAEALVIRLISASIAATAVIRRRTVDRSRLCRGNRRSLRIRRYRDIGAYLGLVPRRYQSGEVDYTGGISKCGDGRVRTLLYEAANVMLTRYKGQLKLKDWAFAIAQRSTMRKALSPWLAAWRSSCTRCCGTKRVRAGSGHQSTRQETASSSQEERRLREGQTTARILLHEANRSPTGFQPRRPAPRLPHQAPNERAERRRPQSVDTEKILPPLTH